MEKQMKSNNITNTNQIDYLSAFEEISSAMKNWVKSLSRKFSHYFNDREQDDISQECYEEMWKAINNGTLDVNIIKTILKRKTIDKLRMTQTIKRTPDKVACYWYYNIDAPENSERNGVGASVGY